MSFFHERSERGFIRSRTREMMHARLYLNLNVVNQLLTIKQFTTLFSSSILGIYFKFQGVNYRKMYR